MSGRPAITVLGGGSFGTVVANVLSQNQGAATLWLRDPTRVEEINLKKENTRYLPGYELHAGLEATQDLTQAVKDKELIFIAIPSKAFREVVKELRGLIQPNTMLVSTTKGIESGGFLLMSQILKEYFPSNPIGVLSGPNLAKEIAKYQLTATVIASESSHLRERVQQTLGNSYLRVYANPDMYGVELGGSLKNIYAIITGMGTALGMGENTKSMLITRSLAEMSRFAEKLGANPLTFLGLAGVGDLIVTCISPLSRNFRVGYAVGKGTSLQAACDELGEVAEGVNTLIFVKQKAEELGVYMPLVSGLYHVLVDGVDPSDLARSMMTNEPSTDVEFTLPRKS